MTYILLSAGGRSRSKSRGTGECQDQDSQDQERTSRAQVREREEEWMKASWFWSWWWWWLDSEVHNIECPGAESYEVTGKRCLPVVRLDKGEDGGQCPLAPSTPVAGTSVNTIFLIRLTFLLLAFCSEGVRGLLVALGKI